VTGGSGRGRESREGPGTSRRRLNLFDALVLVAATAVGLAVTRAFLEALPSFVGKASLSRYQVAGAAPLLATWCLALPVLAARPPRTPFRRLARRPGFAACSSTALGLAAASVLSLIETMCSKLSINGWPLFLVDLVFWLSPLVAPTISGAWLSLALGGRWLPERDWIGMLGRLLGVCWIVLFLAWQSLLRG
jgi:hypothetical protein